MKLKIFNDDNIDETSINNKITRVKALIVNSQKEILLGEAFGTIQFPGGHLEAGENLNDGLKREIKEETGLILNGNYEPFFQIKHLIKDKINNNHRALEIYYYYIFTDEPFHLENTHLDAQEQAGNFHLFYTPLNEVSKLLEETINANPMNKIITEEMLLALEELKVTNNG